MEIILPIIILTVLGLIGSIVLVVAAKFMSVEQDPRIDQVTGCLPGANCGACGYAGCADYAKAVVEGGAPVNLCVPGGANAAKDVAAVMGVEAGATAVVKAVVGCQGKPGVCHPHFDYQGISSCAAAAMLHGGPKACTYGCMGLGDCVKVCKFDALHIVDGIAVVDTEKCTGCGACAKVCPHGVIHVLGVTPEKPRVLCNTTDKGALAMKACTTSCIGCMKCQKTCEHDAIKVENFLARIDYTKCVGCGACVDVCPKKVIQFENRA